MDGRRPQPSQMKQPRPEPPSGMRVVQNFLVVWADQNIDERDPLYQESIKLLRKSVNTIKTFRSVDEGHGFISSNRGEKIFLIASGSLGQKIVPLVHDMAQVNTIYLFCGNKTLHEEWVKKFPKVKGIFTNMNPASSALQNAVQECSHNTISMSFLTTNDGAMNKNLGQFDQSFVYTQVLKELLLTMNFDKNHHIELINFARRQFADNESELNSINKFEKYYSQQRIIDWYSYPDFLSSMLNRSLYKLEVDLIMKLGFAIRDLQEYITQLHTGKYAGQTGSDSFRVYRGQGLSLKEFNQLKKAQDGLLSFNSFLLAYRSQTLAHDFAQKTLEYPDLTGVVFVMKINTSIPSVPFVDIPGKGHNQTGDSILFSMNSIFHIEEIKNIGDNNRLYQVNLTLASKNDPKLRALTEHIQEETYSDAKGWFRLADLSIKLNQFDKAELVLKIMFYQTHGTEQAAIYYKLGMIKEKMEKFEEAKELYKKSLEINQRILPPRHPDLCSIYNSIGQMYVKVDKFQKASAYFEIALEIQQKNLPPNHPDLTASYTNLGNVYKKLNDYVKALEYYEKAYKIYQKTLPPHHPDLAIASYNVGDAFNLMGIYARALPMLEQAVKISQNSPDTTIPDIEKWRKDFESVRDKV